MILQTRNRRVRTLEMGFRLKSYAHQRTSSAWQLYGFAAGTPIAL